MSWQEVLRACWELYPAEVVFCGALAVLCGIGLAVMLFALIWCETSETDEI